MPITSTGLQIPSYQEIKLDNKSQILAGTGKPIDFSETSLMNMINSVYSASLIDAYELLQGVYDQMSLDAADGVQLDILASYLGLTRLPITRSTGKVSFTTNSFNYTIPDATRVRNSITGEYYETVGAQTVSLAAINSVVYSVTSVTEGSTYSFTFFPYGSTIVLVGQYVAQSGDTAEIIADGLAASINTLDLVYAEVEGSTVKIHYSPFSNSTLSPTDNYLRVAGTSNLTFVSTTKAISCQALNFGAVKGTADTITELVDSIAGLSTTVNNPVDFTLGKERESDEELRLRIKSANAGNSFATVSSITSHLLNTVENVRSANTIENETEFYNTIDGVMLPPKSYMVIVDGGEANEIATAINEKRPAGIRHVGNSSGTTTDIFNNTITINYETPVFRHIAVKVNIKPALQNETTPTAQDQLIIDAIKEAVKSQGDLVGIGASIRPTRYIGAIYAAIPTLEYVDVEMGYSDTDILTEGDALVVVSERGTSPTQDGEDTHCPINIAANQVSNFNTAAIVVRNSTVC